MKQETNKKEQLFVFEFISTIKKIKTGNGAMKSINNGNQMLTSGAKHLAMSLAHYVDNETHFTYVNQVTLANECGVGRHSYLNGIDQLMALGLVVRTAEKRKNGSTSYNYQLYSDVDFSRGQPIKVEVGQPVKVEVGHPIKVEVAPCELEGARPIKVEVATHERLKWPPIKGSSGQPEKVKVATSTFSCISTKDISSVVSSNDNSSIVSKGEEKEEKKKDISYNNKGNVFVFNAFDGRSKHECIRLSHTYDWDEDLEIGLYSYKGKFFVTKDGNSVSALFSSKVEATAFYDNITKDVKDM